MSWLSYVHILKEYTESASKRRVTDWQLNHCVPFIICILCVTWQQRHKFIEKLHAFVSALSLWSSTLGQQPHDYIWQAHWLVWRKSSGKRVENAGLSVCYNTDTKCLLYWYYKFEWREVKNNIVIKCMCTWVCVSWNAYWESLPCAW